jgi:Zn-dependent peptidase ImmA (M78 family)
MSAAQIEDRAAALLKQHELYAVPINPVTLAQRIGLSVFDAEFGEDSISGVLRKEDGRFQILVNEHHSPLRKRYTVAHEIAHFCLHSKEIESFVDPELNLFRSKSESSQSEDRSMETQANMFAAALLMPEPFIREAIRETTNLDQLATRFRVSRHAMGIRLNNLDLG